jgi:fatty acid CoA ligase FadD9
LSPAEAALPQLRRIWLLPKATRLRHQRNPLRRPKLASRHGCRLAVITNQEVSMSADNAHKPLGYLDRPALGQRAVQFVKDPNNGRTFAELLPRFETITYRELWERAGAIASAWTNKPVRSGDRVCLLGYASMDRALIDVALIRLGAVAVPLQGGAAVTQLRPIVAEAEPGVIAASIDYLADALELALTGYSPTRLVVFDQQREVDHHQEAVKAARRRLARAHTPVIVETLADVLSRGERLPPAPTFAAPDVVVTYVSNLRLLGLV